QRSEGDRAAPEREVPEDAGIAVVRGNIGAPYILLVILPGVPAEKGVELAVAAVEVVARVLFANANDFPDALFSGHGNGAASRPSRERAPAPLGRGFSETSRDHDRSVR